MDVVQCELCEEFIPLTHPLDGGKKHLLSFPLNPWKVDEIQPR